MLGSKGKQGLIALAQAVASTSGRQAGIAQSISAASISWLRWGQQECVQPPRRSMAHAAMEEPDEAISFDGLPGAHAQWEGRSTRRTGLLAVKVGMTQDWDHWGARMPLTVLWVDDCQVVQVKRPEVDGYSALQLGCGAKRPKQVSATQRGHFDAAGVPIKRKLAEFRVTPDAVLPVGFTLLASHFVPGQYVDVSGTTIGKGFQGVIKRWGFAGQPASHGNSKAHRAAGSTGACQDPGKVFKGKKMPGRMGGVQRTIQNCLVWRVDAARNLVYVRGQVPGHKGNFVLVEDAVRKAVDQQPPLPVPTFLGGELPSVMVAPREGMRDPFDFREG